ncbi:MAG: MFS transporter [Corynebacteriales bacterium]|nr:MFS transporter [Mycobacteriales bacterium]
MPSQHAKAGRKEWIGFSVLMLPLLLVSMDVSVLYFAVPYISQDLEPSGTQQLWMFDIYGFVLAGLLITMGALGDKIGRRRLLLLGALAFGSASLLAAYAHTAETLIAARALLGIGGATLMPSTLALIRNMFHDEKQRSTAIAIWTGAMTGGVALGPILSGFLLEHFWWGSIFLINTPAMVALLLLAPMLVPEFKNPKAGKFDILSSGLSLSAVLPTIYGIKEIASHGLELAPVIYIGIGIVLGAIFVRRQLTSSHPMIDPQLFRRRAFTGSIAMNLLAMFALVGFAIFTTQYLQSVLGMSPFEAALWSLVPSLGVGAAAPVVTKLAQRGINRAYVMAGGFTIAALGFAVLTQVQATSALWVVLTGATIYAAGLMAVMTLVTEMVMGAAPPERAGTASALLETGTEFGGALGLALLGSLGAATFHREMGNASDVPHAAQDTLGGALAVAAQLDEPIRENLVATAREAFTHGMQIAAIGGGLVMAAGAICAVIFLRHVAPTVEPEGSTTAELAPSTR